MKSIEEKGFRYFLNGTASALILSASIAVAPSALAQDNAEEEVVEEVVVTGSRIRRGTFTSASPIQTMNIDAARQIGINSVSDLLQQSSVANGQQINAELNTNAGNSNASEPPPSGGVGSANIALRGLAPERTLILVNSRRLGSSGVRGAPSQPDMNLLPLNLIERVEIITDGASSIYGADAVAGVVNILLRDEFDGMEVSGSYSNPFDGGGETKQISFITGGSTDKAKFVISGEYFDRKRVRLSDRIECRQNIARDAATGQLLESFCQAGFPDNVIYSGGGEGAGVDADGNLATGNGPWLFYTQGSTDIGIDNFSSALAFPALGTGQAQQCNRADQRCRALGPIPYYDSANDRYPNDLIQPITRFSTVALASYSPDWWGNNEEFYFETYYMNRHAEVFGATEQIFPTINPLAFALDADGNRTYDADGPIMVDNPLSPFDSWAVPIVTLADLNQNRDVELQQYRFVAGFRGDLPSAGNWNYDVFMSYDRGTGIVEQKQMSEENLLQSLNTVGVDPDGNVSCGYPTTDIFGFVTRASCVPVNFFAPNIYADTATTNGSLTAEEAAWLIGSRVNSTSIEQFMASAIFSGDLFEMPAGNVGMAVGAEYRKDTIKSFADFISAKSQNAGENPLAEGATLGKRDIYDIFGEVNVPLVAGEEMIEYLGVEGAVRYTDEQNFGSKVTTRARFSYRPNDWMQFSGSYGTSFRAPNLRETYLAEQIQGVSSSADTCSVPPAANDNNTYVPANDPRSAQTLANCVLSGADPTLLGITAGVNLPVIISGNALTLNPESSRSFTGVFQMSPNVSDSVDVDFAVSYFNIRITDSIRSVAPSTIISRCFNGPANLASPFCDRLERVPSGGDPAFDFLTTIDASFLNVGLETSKGLDFNLRLQGNVDKVALAWNGALTVQTERKERIFEEDAFNDLLGDFGMPKYRLTSTLSAMVSDFEFIWNTRYLSGGESDMDTRIGNHCDDPNEDTNRATPNQVLPVCDAPGAMYHNLSATYNMDSVIFTLGINNVFDKQPPLVSGAAGSNRGNRVTSSGYDQFGRSIFFNVTASF